MDDTTGDAFKAERELVERARSLIYGQIDALPHRGLGDAASLREFRDSVAPLVRASARVWALVNPEFDGDDFYEISNLWTVHGATIHEHSSRILEEQRLDDVVEDEEAGLGEGVPAIASGLSVLESLLLGAGWASIEAAVAAHAVFLPPATVQQAGRGAMFPVVRNASRRGQIEALPDGRMVMFDDNRTPTDAFLWAAQSSRPQDVQFNHIWTCAQDPDAYTALWNLCATPSFLAKTTDTHPRVKAVLQYRAWDLYGFRPEGEGVPTEPDGYDGLSWAPMPAPAGDLEAVFRSRLVRSSRSRPALAARSVGWRFSDGPDPALG